MKTFLIPRAICPYCGAELYVTRTPFDGHFLGVCMNISCTNPYKRKDRYGQFSVMGYTTDIKPIGE